MDEFLTLIAQVMGKEWFERYGGEVFLRKDRLRRQLREFIDERMRYAVSKDSPEVKIRGLRRNRERSID